MPSFIEHVHILTTQAAGTAQFPTPLNVGQVPMVLDSVAVYLSAVAGSPTGVTIDLNITDGTTTVTPVEAQSIGTAAGQVILAPSTTSGYHNVAVDLDDNWRYNLDFNFTAGSTPTVTGRVVVRWRI